MQETISEHNTLINAFVDDRVSKKLPVFYNPVMKLNRDLSIILLNSLPDTDMQIALPLAASGVRGIRFLKELKKSKIRNISFNDHSESAIRLISENLKLNHIEEENVNLSCDDANLFLLNSNGFDYIDIDPFGNPNKFLDSAVNRLSRNGILAVTATDTSSLAGSFQKTCLRHYWALPQRNALKHETGLRILIRKVQLIAAQYDRALTPIFSYAKDHYMRVIFRCKKSRTATDNLIKNYGMLADAGPLWLGQLWDNKLTKKMLKLDPENQFLKTITEEAQIQTAGFMDIHDLAKKHKIGNVKKSDLILEAIRNKGFNSSPTHFSKTGIRTDIPEKQFVRLIEQK